MQTFKIEAFLGVKLYNISMPKGEKAKRPKKAAKPKTVSESKKAVKRRPAKKTVHVHAKLPGSLRLGWQSLSILNTFKRPLGGIFLIYLGLNLLFASGVGIIGSNITNLRENTSDTSRIGQAFTDFGALAGGAGWSSDQTSSALQSILFIIASLAVIWALRQVLAGEKVTVKDAYYKGMSPLVPFILLLFVIILQLLPMTIGAAILGIVSTGAFGVAATLIFAAVFLLLATWSLYMLSCSVLALYIVTLPDMHPRQALRSAKRLIIGRRLSVMRRLMFLPFLILLTLAAVFIPILLILPPLAAPLFFVFAGLSVFAAHTYLYNLYRRLLA